jgi:ABC transporter substrate binding protein
MNAPIGTNTHLAENGSRRDGPRIEGTSRPVIFHLIPDFPGDVCRSCARDHIFFQAAKESSSGIRSSKGPACFLSGPRQSLRQLATAIRCNPVEISTEDGLEDAFAAMNKATAQALILLTDPILFSQRKRIVDLASKFKLPAVYFVQGFVEEGGLMSYGPSDADLFRRTAGYVDRILKGTKPGELPVEQPTKFDLYVNLRTAKTLGVTIPEIFLARADKVIE